jgi:hypothetical protein
MGALTCEVCGVVNDAPPEQETCSDCGASLASARLKQTLAAIEETTARMKNTAPPAKSFYTFNGFGTTLLDYRRRADGLHEATRWVVAMMIPLVPLTAYVVRLGAEERSYGRETQRFEIIEQIPLAPARVLWVYLLVAAAFLPLYLFGYHDLLGLRTLGLKPFLFRGLLPIVWAGFIIFYWLQKK